MENQKLYKNIDSCNKNCKSIRKQCWKIIRRDDKSRRYYCDYKIRGGRKSKKYNSRKKKLSAKKISIKNKK